MKKRSFFPAFLCLLINCIMPVFSSAQLVVRGGGHNSYAVCNDSTVMSWGHNGYSQLGNGTGPSAPSYVPVPVSLLTGVIAIEAGYNHCIALKEDSTVWVWGWNLYGQLGIGNYSNSNIPVNVSSLSGIIAIAGGGSHSLALKSDGTVWAWGENTYGELGDGSNTSSNVPVQVTGLTGITAISTGEYFSLALKNDGTVWTWGYNQHGQLGNGNNSNSNVPVQVNTLTNVIAVESGGSEHALALKNDSTVWAWGRNQEGQLGTGNNSASNVPVLVSSLSGIVRISTGYYHSVALKSDSTVHTWGRNDSGQLGNGTFTDSNVPVQVNTLTGISFITGGSWHNLAMQNNGTVWSWGFNYDGQLGNGNNSGSNVAVQVTGLCNMVTGIEGTALQLDLSAYPNPFSTQTILEAGNTLNNVTLILYNSLGEPVKELRSISGRTITLYRDNLAGGLYFARLTQGNRVIATKKLLIAD